MMLEQAEEYLESLGLTLPDYVVEALLSSINEKRECLEANYSEGNILLICSYILALLATTQGAQYISSRSLPGGLSQSFRYKDDADLWSGQLALLKGADPEGGVSDLIPDDPFSSSGGHIKWGRIYR